MNKETITISVEEYNRLLMVDKHMDALRAAGVDNWEGWFSQSEDGDYGEYS